MSYEIKKRNIFLIVLIACLIGAFVLKGDLKLMVSIILHIHILWLGLGFVSILIYWIIEAVTLHMMLTQKGNHIRYTEVLKVILSTQFFNGITPFASGGQPFQIYMLTKKSRIDASTVTSASVNNFIVYQFILVFLGSIAMTIKYFYASFVGSPAHTISNIAVLGFILNFVVICILLMLSTQPTISKKMIFSLFSLLEKTPLRERILHLRPKTEGFMKRFHKHSQNLFYDKRLMIKTSALNLIKLLFFYMIAYFACRSIGYNNVTVFQAVIASAYIMLITSFIPIPGASGGSEAGFIVLFGTLLTAPQVTVVMLLWRFITYYFGLLIGFITYYFGYNISRKTTSY